MKILSGIRKGPTVLLTEKVARMDLTGGVDGGPGVTEPLHRLPNNTLIRAPKVKKSLESRFLIRNCFGSLT